MKKYFFSFIGAFLLFGCGAVSVHAQVINQLISQAAEEQYACSMHAEIRAAKPGKCPKCGMNLFKITGAVTEEFILKTQTLPARIKAGQAGKIQFTVFNPQTLSRVTDFHTQHEKLFHLFIVSHDLNFFAHIHPDQKTDGSFTVTATLPKAGLYHVYSDIFPVGGMPQVIHQSLVTAGFSAQKTSLQATLQPENSLAKKADTVIVKLASAPTKIVAGSPAILRYQLSDAKTGAPVTDLAQYLGAWGHVLILREDCTDFIHSHPLEVVQENNQSPSTIYFEAEFSQPGNYRVWSQFQRAGKIITAFFDVRVSPPE